MRPDTTDALDTVRIPIVKADGTRDYYAAAQFPDRVTAVVQDALVAGFEASGRIDQVSTEQDTLHADYDLVSEIRDFEAKYDAPDGIPTILVTISVKLATVRGRRIVGSFTTAQKVPAGANSTAAATQAFETALVAASNEVVAWALSKQLPLPG